MLRRGQFTLASLFVATAFIALACAATRYAVAGAEPMGKLYALASIPVLLCGAFGAFRGRLRLWLAYGVGIDVAVVGFILLSLLIGTG